MEALELIAKNEIVNRKADENYKPAANVNYSTFVELFLEEQIMDEKYSPVRSMNSWTIPTFCTWKGIPTVDDVDVL